MVDCCAEIVEQDSARRSAAAESMAVVLRSEVDMMQAAMGAAAERVQHALTVKDTYLAALETKVAASIATTSCFAARQWGHL